MKVGIRVLLKSEALGFLLFCIIPRFLDFTMSKLIPKFPEGAFMYHEGGCRYTIRAEKNTAVGFACIGQRRGQKNRRARQANAGFSQ